MKPDSQLNTMTYAFALRVVKAYKYLTNEQKEFVLSKQLLRSGTSIGANCREAIYAQSDEDFIHKLSIALKEASETAYWLDLLHDTEYIDEQAHTSIKTDCTTLIKMLTAIIVKKKQAIAAQSNRP